MTEPQPSDTTPARPAWWAFGRRYLFDYPPRAQAAWAAVAAGGALALGWALWQVLALPAADAGPPLLALALVALAANLVLKLGSSSYSFSVADIFIFSALASQGPAVAVLAAGVEGLIATWRTSQRLSSRVASPAAAMIAMAACGAAFEVTKAAAVAGLGMTVGVASLAALCAVALLPFVIATVTLTGIVALKRGAPLRPLAWLADSAWMAAMYQASAFVAGLVQLNARRSGPAVLVISAAMVLGLALLLRYSQRRQEAERRVQQDRLAEAQREAELNQQRFTAAFTHAAIGMAIVRPCGTLLQVNEALCALVGRTPQALIGQPFCDLLHEGDAPLFRRHADAVATRPEESFSMELRAVGPDSGDLWVAVHCSQYDDPGGNGHCLIYQLHDITSRHLAESRLHHSAYHDGLTDLANRNCFNERLEVAVERSRLDPAQRFAVLFLDLDRFKIVNDSLGHLAGNALLREVAQRLRQCVRPKDLVARLGGDEFAILLEDLHDHGDSQRLAQRVLDALGRPVAINGIEVVAGASVGITFSDLGYRTVDEVLRDADLAMYEAKAGGRGRVALFDSVMHEKVAEKLALEGELRRAIGEGQLSVHFQPLYALEQRRLVGFEALVRWQHPQRGMVSPAVFVALAEESGHIEALTDWVLDHALAQLAQWQRELPAARRLGLHVNISGRDLGRANLVGQVRQLLQRHRPTPGTLTLEITETTLMGRLETALQTLNGLRDSGVGLSIDDFGTGYSSLAYLSTLPIDSLKIDRSFVMGLHDKPQNVEIVRAVLTLGRSLGRKVIAEGIETPEQLATLRELGVPVGQGYLLSRPLRADQVPALLAAEARVLA
jgi:diguanylate cyclase (GGDEF)-like protein/PAS domain S-box-containing protein